MTSLNSSHGQKSYLTEHEKTRPSLAREEINIKAEDSGVVEQVFTTREVVQKMAAIQSRIVYQEAGPTGQQQTPALSVNPRLQKKAPTGLLRTVTRPQGLFAYPTGVLSPKAAEESTKLNVLPEASQITTLRIKQPGYKEVTEESLLETLTNFLRSKGKPNRNESELSF